MKFLLTFRHNPTYLTVRISRIELAKSLSEKRRKVVLERHVFPQPLADSEMCVWRGGEEMHAFP